MLYLEIHLFRLRYFFISSEAVNFSKILKFRKFFCKSKHDEKMCELFSSPDFQQLSHSKVMRQLQWGMPRAYKKCMGWYNEFKFELREERVMQQLINI